MRQQALSFRGVPSQLVKPASRNIKHIVDSQTLSIFRALFNDELNERRQALTREIATVKSAAASVGALGNSRVRLQIQELCRNELRIRVKLAWDILQRVLSRAGVALGDSLAVELKEQLHSVLSQQSDELFDVLKGQFRSGTGSWDPSVIATEQQSLLPVFDAQVDLLVLELQQRTKSPAGIVNNFYGGNYGAVVTGSGSATVAQTITDSDSQALLQALRIVQGAVESAADLANETRRDLLDVVSELTDELQKPKKNRLRVTQLASGVALTLQTAASLKPAFDNLKGVLVAMGIPVPF